MLLTKASYSILSLKRETICEPLVAVIFGAFRRYHARGALHTGHAVPVGVRR